MNETRKEIMFGIKEGLKELIDLIDDEKTLNFIWTFFSKTIPKLKEMDYID